MSATTTTPRGNDPAFVHKAFSTIAPRYTLANHLLSGGLDWWWRYRLCRAARAQQPQRILDVATGTGDLARALHRTCSQAAITGVDFCEPMIEVAKQKGGAEFLVADGLDLPFADESFSLVTIAFGLRNMGDWEAATREMARVLEPGGHLLILDFSLPSGRLGQLYRWYLHKILPRLGGWIAGDRAAYGYLATSIDRFPSGENLCQFIEAQGFVNARHRSLSGGITALYSAAKC